MCVLACLPAEAVAAQPLLQCIRSPSVVEFALKNRGVPRETARAALGDRFRASVRLTGGLRAFLVLICSNATKVLKHLNV